MANSTVLLVGALVGVYYGINMLQPPHPKKVVALCSEYNFTRIRLPNPETDILDAFFEVNNFTQPRNTLTLDIPNSSLMKMNDKSSVQSWFYKFVKAYSKGITFEYIVVGENGHQNILPTMTVLRNLLNTNNLTRVKLTTIVSDQSLIIQDPPSKGAFHPHRKQNLKQVLTFLVNQGKPELMVSLYPYKKYFYVNRNGMSIDYATFGGRDSVQDGSFTYHNLFDAMVDTVYVAIEKLGDNKLKNVSVVIGETGWPTNGGRKGTNVTLAQKYNKNLIKHMNSGKGTPRRPNVAIKGFIRSLFNENGRQEGESRYYGLFNTNLTPVYPLFNHT